jgi:hypothetical protein
MEIHLVGAELFHADAQTEGQIHMTKLIVAFRSFSNAPKNLNNLSYYFIWLKNLNLLGSRKYIFL